MRTITNTLIIGLVLVSFVIAGCGGPPQNNPLLTQAQNAYQQAENDSLIVVKAPVALKEAEEALEQSQQIWEDKGDKKLIEHYAYIAEQKTKIAKETAMLNAAQDEVERAETERQKVLIEARRAEAIAAEQRAKIALEEVQQARNETEKLASRLSEMEARQSERGMVLTLRDVLFDFDSTTLKSGASSVVNELSNFLKEYPERSIQIEGFTDSIGSAEYNRNLSQQRADALKMAIVRTGISSQRIQTIGYGEEFPVATNMNEAGRQQNRRVEIIISNENGVVTQRTQ
jgi:outer membrane protein OmpA-like peptidoglycan-associated protein